MFRGKLLAAAWAAHKAPEDDERDDQVPAAAPSTGMEKTKSQKKRDKKKQKKQQGTAVGRGASAAAAVQQGTAVGRGVSAAAAVKKEAKEEKNRALEKGKVKKNTDSWETHIEKLTREPQAPP